MSKVDRVGQTFVNNEGCQGVIEKYINSSEVYVRFPNCKNLIKTSYANCKRGEVKNPLYKSVYSVGFIGEGKYPTNGQYKKCYRTWKSMLERCYLKDDTVGRRAYTDCVVCEEWHNYQNFAEWYENNYYEVKGEQMCLDKDILVKENKIYSSKTCVFVPQTINKLFNKQAYQRGNLPIGVRYDSKRDKYYCDYTYKGKTKYIGSSTDVEQCFKMYKKCKECLIKEVAREYESVLPPQVYNAMCNYEVLITD